MDSKVAFFLSFAVCLRKVIKAKVDLLEKEKKPKVE